MYKILKVICTLKYLVSLQQPKTDKLVKLQNYHSIDLMVPVASSYASRIDCDIKAEITSGGQVTIKKYQSYITSITCKSNLILLIRYPFFVIQFRYSY
jgi:hypothetical protein